MLSIRTGTLAAPSVVEPGSPKTDNFPLLEMSDDSLSEVHGDSGVDGGTLTEGQIDEFESDSTVVAEEAERYTGDIRNHTYEATVFTPEDHAFGDLEHAVEGQATVAENDDDETMTYADSMAIMSDDNALTVPVRRHMAGHGWDVVLQPASWDSTTIDVMEADAWAAATLGAAIILPFDADEIDPRVTGD